eukprot:CAMPEP_0180158496 /NCGR_PEP_ID=MMETSP0986-20121125/26939_1 /TAXON_ID=697907 /ORGANISM="non described non described, Strain CCMP2293" /LENGTH=62 /DNA_ID=CAMNT_0022108353 /DNA_START=476 /DNA_END=664 /DNA_ORIENTATION=+
MSLCSRRVACLCTKSSSGVTHPVEFSADAHRWKPGRAASADLAWVRGGRSSVDLEGGCTGET